MTKLTPAQAYALQVKADRRAAAIERQNGVIREDNARIESVLSKRDVAVNKVVKVKRTSSKKVRWSSAELDLLIELYIKYADTANGSDNREMIVSDFLAQYPERGSAAVIFGVMQVKGLDVHYNAKGLKDTSQALIDKLYSVDPVRFPGGATKEEKVFNALDSLLAEIRG